MMIKGRKGRRSDSTRDHYDHIHARIGSLPSSAAERLDAALAERPSQDKAAASNGWWSTATSTPAPTPSHKQQVHGGGMVSPLQFRDALQRSSSVLAQPGNNTTISMRSLPIGSHLSETRPVSRQSSNMGTSRSSKSSNAPDTIPENDTLTSNDDDTASTSTPPAAGAGATTNGSKGVNRVSSAARERHRHTAAFSPLSIASAPSATALIDIWNPSRSIVPRSPQPNGSTLNETARQHGMLQRLRGVNGLPNSSSLAPISTQPSVIISLEDTGAAVAAATAAAAAIAAATARLPSARAGRPLPALGGPSSDRAIPAIVTARGTSRSPPRTPASARHHSLMTNTDGSPWSPHSPDQKEHSTMLMSHHDLGSPSSPNARPFLPTSTLSPSSLLRPLTRNGRSDDGPRPTTPGERHVRLVTPDGLISDPNTDRYKLTTPGTQRSGQSTISESKRKKYVPLPRYYPVIIALRVFFVLTLVSADRFSEALDIEALHLRSFGARGGGGGFEERVWLARERALTHSTAQYCNETQVGIHVSPSSHIHTLLTWLFYCW
jgi:hypothetical protein